MPSPGQPFVIDQTNVTVTRISDVGDPENEADSYTNGYSRWSPANRTGQYVTAFGNNGTASIYRLSDRSVVTVLDVGEPNELQWDMSGDPDTDTILYYRKGAVLYSVDVLGGTPEVVHDFSDEYPGAQDVINGVEGAPSNDMRYWAFQVCGGMTSGGQCTGIMDVIVYDKQTDQIAGQLSSLNTPFPTPNFVDMSPSGSKIVVGTCKESSGTQAPWNGPYAWSRDFSDFVRLSTNCNHSGWAWGRSGEEYYVGFDPCGANNEEPTRTCDHLTAVDVNDQQGWQNRIGILAQEDIGWGIGFHFGRIYRSSVPGWIFASTYADSSDTWASNQLFFIEVVDEASGPRLWRIGPTLNIHQGYWSEAFASLDFSSTHVYWGANWNETGELELYQAALCDGWWQALKR